MSKMFQIKQAVHFLMIKQNIGIWLIRKIRNRCWSRNFKHSRHVRFLICMANSLEKLWFLNKQRNVSVVDFLEDILKTQIIPKKEGFF